MKKKFLLAAGAVAWSALLAVSASAQERGWGETRIAAPQNAFEMSVNTGYTQGFGTLSPGVSLPNVSSAGVGVGLGLGYRVSPELLLGINGQYNELTSEGGYTGTRGVSAGVNADFHFAPTNRIDPWLSVGAGYRGLWQVPGTPGPTSYTQGLQLARVTAGLNVRASKDVALGPMIGADLNMALWDKRAGDFRAIPDPKLSTFVFAGIQGSFDIGGDRVRGPLPSTVARR